MRDILLEIFWTCGFQFKHSISNVSALDQVMAWCWTGDKPLAKPKLKKIHGASSPPLSLNLLNRPRNFEKKEFSFVPPDDLAP